MAPFGDYADGGEPMETDAIDRQIRQAVEHEKRTGTLLNLLRQYAQSHGARPSAADLAGTVTFVGEYVKHALAILQELEAAAQRAGASQEIAPLVSAAEQYFLAPVDLIPDQLGLVGLIDDAYLAHSLVQAASDQHRQRTGVALLPTPMDLTAANQVIRSLIGEPIASQLDAAVAGAVVMPAFQQALAQFPVMGSPLPMVRDPIWGDMSINDRTNHMMGMLGIF